MQYTITSRLNLPNLFKFGIILAALSLAGCGAGYQQENGRWVFIEFNESAGKVVKPIAGVDQHTFEVINGQYARDTQRVYYRDNPIEGADPVSFEHVSGLFWKDARQVYYVDQVIPGADPRTFRQLKYTYWARDDRNVYVTTNPVNPRDMKSFKQISQYWAKDDLWYYPQNSGKYLPISELDYDTFQILKGGWAKDCCRVYYTGRVVEGADPSSFYTVNEFRGRDKAWAYLMGTRQRTLEEDLELEKRLKNP
jgi:hypothetical protein